MNLGPKEHLNNEEVEQGLRRIVKEGMFAESMATLTGGTFLVALTLKLGASNVLIGLLAALPTIGMVFQLPAVYFVQRYRNRRVITVIASSLSRFPLLLVGFAALTLSSSITLALIPILLFVHYLFASIGGVSWNSWMKDLVPETRLGSYFSGRTRKLQIVSVLLSLSAALLLDFFKKQNPEFELTTYAGMFLVGGVIGLIGIYLLATTPEPMMQQSGTRNVLKLFGIPFRDRNFRRLIAFNSFWSFAINLAAPFFTVYLITVINLDFIFIIGLNTLSTLCSIFCVRLWGTYADRYSNKTIISFCAPFYLLCIFAWTFTTLPDPHAFTIPLLVLIYIFNGISTAGINLSITNMGLKLAPKKDAVAYLTMRGMVTALFSALSPVIGGLLADYFSQRELRLTLMWRAPESTVSVPTIAIENWDFFFVLAVLLAMIALRLLRLVKEEGEVEREVVRRALRSRMKARVRVFQGIAGLGWVSLRSFGMIQGAKPISNIPRVGMQIPGVADGEPTPQLRPDGKEDEVWISIED